MPVFFYSGKDTKGRAVRGTVEAISTQDARDSLRGMNIESEELHEATMEEKNAVDTGSFSSLDEPRDSSIVFDFVDTNNKLDNSIDNNEDIKLKSMKSLDDKNIKTDKANFKKNLEIKNTNKTKKEYYPFIDTIRLYAGWLLAWYALVYALGGYQITRELPFSFPYVEALLPPYSSIVFSCTIAAFLFLLLSAIHKLMNGGIIRGFSLSIFGIAIFFLYKMNI